MTSHPAEVDRHALTTSCLAAMIIPETDHIIPVYAVYAIDNLYEMSRTSTAILPILLAERPCLNGPQRRYFAKVNTNTGSVPDRY